MSDPNLLQQKIDFFQKSADVKEQIAVSENERIKLEMELNRLLNSDDSIAKSKALKLKAYYTKLCDDEAKSMKRNQQLLLDLQRVDTQFQQLDSKLERLTNLKKECEIYLRTAYPQWSSENRVAQAAGLQNNDARQYTLSKGAELIAENLHRIEQLNQSKLNDLYREESLISKLEQSLNESQTIKTPLLEAVSLFTGTSYQDDTLKRTSSVPQRVPTPPQAEPEAAPNAALRNLVSQVVEKQPFKSIDSPSANNNKNNSNLIYQELGTTMGMNNLLREYEQEIKRQDTNQYDFTMVTTLNTNNHTNEQEANAPNSTIKQLFSQMAEKQSTEANKIHKEGSAPPIRSMSEEQEMNVPNSTIRQLFNQTADKKTLETNTFKESPISPVRLKDEAKLDLNGLFRLLDYVELEIKHIIHPENYYRHNEVSPSSKNEIIRSAQENKSLEEMDSLNVSMVIKDQLPNVIRNHTSQSCLFDMDLLDESMSDINDNVVRSYLGNKQDLAVWDRLLKHFMMLRKMALIDSFAISQLFAPALVSDIRRAEKAAKILEKIINQEVDQSDLLSDSVTETSINKELQLASSSKLKHSSAYQQFILNSTQVSNKSKNVQSDDENDEIDALVAPKSTASTLNESNKPNLVIASILKSPRKKSELEFDYAQSLKSTDKNSTGMRTLDSLRSSKDKKLPVHLRDFDDSEDETEESENDNNKKKSIRIDTDFDFYK